MIRYDWNVMRKLPINDLMVIIFALANHENLHDYPRKILEPISNFEDMSAYLLKPLPFILARKNHTETEIYLYLELAAYRSYIEYKDTGSCRLPTNYIKTKYNLGKLKFNTMLDVTDKEIIFRYEEN